MKIGVSSYSYSRLCGPGKMTVFDIVARAREMGFEAIEFAGIQVPEAGSLEGAAMRLRDECASAGLQVVSYTIGADFLSGSGGDLDSEIERLKGEVRIAKALGVPLMRHDATRGFPPGHVGPRGFSDALPRLVKGCRAVTEYGAGLGIRTTVENHGFFCQDSERVEMLANGVNHPNFGILLDIGNFLCADEDPALACGRLMPYVFHVHVKDFHVKPGTGPNPGKGWFQSRGGNYLRGAIIGHGDAPVWQCLRIVKKTGYDGVLSIEFEGIEDPILGISTGKENLTRYLRDL